MALHARLTSNSGATIGKPRHRQSSLSAAGDPPSWTLVGFLLLLLLITACDEVAVEDTLDETPADSDDISETEVSDATDTQIPPRSCQEIADETERIYLDALSCTVDADCFLSDLNPPMCGWPNCDLVAVNRELDIARLQELEVEWYANDDCFEEDLAGSFCSGNVSCCHEAAYCNGGKCVARHPEDFSFCGD